MHPIEIPNVRERIGGAQTEKLIFQHVHFFKTSNSELYGTHSALTHSHPNTPRGPCSAL
eukprot:SAG31_NODE_574_length_13967_cov_7.512042_13_plen_59_part_00